MKGKKFPNLEFVVYLNVKLESEELGEGGGQRMAQRAKGIDWMLVDICRKMFCLFYIFHPLYKLT